MKHILSLIILLILITLACGQATPAATPGPQPPTPTSQPPTATPQAPFPFTIALEYGILGVAEAYAATGVTYVKLQMVFSIWGNIEPEPGQYNWRPLDAAVQEYQAAGFTGLQLLLTAESRWASINPVLNGDTFPKEEYVDDYVTFVTRVAERYDADGVDDMPGLLYPIHHYGLEREFTGYWPGSANDYVRLLRLAYPAIHAADPQAEVLLVALLMSDVFNGTPGPVEIENRLAQTPSFRKSAGEIQTILAACDSYDMVDFHSLADYAEIPSTAAWIREQLAALDCPPKPIWIGDTFPMSGLVGFGGFVPPIPFAPATLQNRDQVVALLKAAADPAAPDHAPAEAWLRAEVARGLVKKLIVAAGAELRGVNVGNMEDWRSALVNVDVAAVPMVGASMFMGLMDTSRTFQRPGAPLVIGEDWERARQAGAARPGFYAMALVQAKIGSFSRVEKLDLGEGVWAYRFETAAGPVWVLWYDDGRLHLPGDPPPTASVELPFAATNALITFTPTTPAEGQGRTEVVMAAGGRLSLTLNSTPVFIRVYRN